MEETTDLPQVTDKLYHIMYQVGLAWAGFELTLVMIGIDGKGSYKSNYYTITTVPCFLLAAHFIWQDQVANTKLNLTLSKWNHIH